MHHQKEEMWESSFVSINQGDMVYYAYVFGIKRETVPCTTLGVSAPSLASSLKQITVGAQLATRFEHESGVVT